MRFLTLVFLLILTTPGPRLTTEIFFKFTFKLSKLFEFKVIRREYAPPGKSTPREYASPWKSTPWEKQTPWESTRREYDSTGGSP